MLTLGLILCSIFGAFLCSIPNSARIKGNEKIGSFGLDEKGEDDEFTLTKLFDIHLKGGYENLHPDLKEVIRSQLQPELKDKLEEHLSTDNSLLEKLENFTESQSTKRFAATEADIIRGTCVNCKDESYILKSQYYSYIIVLIEYRAF
nr:uncharacterized protein LOC111507257 [Leptinotarsa decemlineata]